MNLLEDEGNIGKLIIAMWIAVVIFALGYTILPFVLAHVLELSWINWFGILTVPSGVVTIIAVILQMKLFYD